MRLGDLWTLAYMDFIRKVISCRKICNLPRGRRVVARVAQHYHTELNLFTPCERQWSLRQRVESQACLESG